MKKIPLLPPKTPGDIRPQRHCIVQTALLAALLLFISLSCWLHQPQSFSLSERRSLAALPQLSWSAVLSGDFMQDFEAYSLDQFPRRDDMRRVKALASRWLFARGDNNGLYVQQGHLSRLEYPLKQQMLDHAAEHFRSVYDNYLSAAGCRVYLSIIPDKNYFLAAANGYPALDYDYLLSYMQQQCSYMSYIDIFPLLELDDYYRTDSHWRQECISDVADCLANAMGVTLSAAYEQIEVEQPFYGVYYGQSALPLAPDRMVYLDNDMLAACTVTGYSSGSPQQAAVYRPEKAGGRDAYELFLGGADPLIVIENPAATTGRKLIIFRDSYGSSLAPLLVEAYAEITLVDTRYVRSELLGSLVDFSGQDVLFIYSTSLLNNSLALQ